MRRISTALIMGMMSFVPQFTLAEDDVVLEDRIDFSSARIMGQANDFGAVYLMHRKANDMNSLLSIRSNYRWEILENFEYYLVDPLTGEWIAPQAFGSDAFEAGFEPALSLLKGRSDE